MNEKVRDYVGEALAAVKSKPEANGGGAGTDWQEDLLRSSKTKQPKSLLANALIALRHAPEWQGVLAHDEFALADDDDEAGAVAAGGQGKMEGEALG